MHLYVFGVFMTYLNGLNHKNLPRKNPTNQLSGLRTGKNFNPKPHPQNFINGSVSKTHENTPKINLFLQTLQILDKKLMYQYI